MRVEKMDRSIPSRLASKNQKLELAGLAALYEDEFALAEKRFQEQYELLLNAQSEAGRPIHKGAPLHNLGLALFGQGREEDGIRRVLMAYVEDALDCDYGVEDSADTRPAAIVLRDILKVNPGFLEEIKKACREVKETEKWAKAIDPAPLLDKVIGLLGLDARNLGLLYTRKTTLVDAASAIFIDDIDRRVFIGSDYDQHAAAIATIKTAVELKGYTPVVAYDLNLPKNRSHYYSLLLLHSCRYAIFDITSYAGQLMELERCQDYEVKVLCVRNILNRRELGKRVSGMIRTMKSSPRVKIRPYKDDFDLLEVVKEFLPKVK